jgi:hypothetical protein
VGLTVSSSGDAGCVQLVESFFTYRMEITGPAADTVGPELGQQISGDFPEALGPDDSIDWAFAFDEPTALAEEDNGPDRRDRDAQAQVRARQGALGRRPRILRRRVGRPGLRADSPAGG